MSLALAHDEAPPTQDCCSCTRMSDWGFCRDFFRHEEAVRQQARGLQHQVTQMGHALHQAGLNSQNDHLALNGTRQLLVDLEDRLRQSESARGRLETILDAKHQELRQCQESLNRERTHVQEIEKNLTWLWNANDRLGLILKEVHCKNAGEEPGTYDLSTMVHEIEIKTIKIEELEKSIQDEEQDHLSQVQIWDTRLQEQSTRIDELEQKIREKNRSQGSSRRYRRNGTEGRAVLE